MRSAALVFLPIKEISMVEVFEDKMHSAEHAFSRSEKICCLMGIFSTAASITCRRLGHCSGLPFLLFSSSLKLEAIIDYGLCYGFLSAKVPGTESDLLA